MAKNSFSLPTISDEEDVKVLTSIKNIGWHVVYVEAEDNMPSFTYSVGFFHTFNHPEVIMFGLKSQTAFSIMASIAGEIKTGKTYCDGYVDNEQLANATMIFKSFDVNAHGGLLGYNCWLYQKEPNLFPAIQMVWPDKQGIFPWEPGFDRIFYTRQPVLKYIV